MGTCLILKRSLNRSIDLLSCDSLKTEQEVPPCDESRGELWMVTVVERGHSLHRLTNKEGAMPSTKVCIGTFLHDGGTRSCRAGPRRFVLRRFVLHPRARKRIDTCQCIITGRGANTVRIYTVCGKQHTYAATSDDHHPHDTRPQDLCHWGRDRSTGKHA